MGNIVRGVGKHKRQYLEGLRGRKPRQESPEEIEVGMVALRRMEEAKRGGPRGKKVRGRLPVTP